MAKYYYDRHKVDESTSWDWTKHIVVDENYYTEGGWGAEVEVPGTSHKQGRSSITFHDLHGWEMSVSSRTLSGLDITTPPGRSPYVYDDFKSSVNVGGVVYWREVTRYYFRMNDAPNPTSSLYYQTSKPLVMSSRKAKGGLVETVTGQAYNYKQHDRINSDGFWWVRGPAQTTQSKGDYIDTVEAEQGTYPANGVLGGYWYVLSKRVFPEMKIKLDDQLETSADGWVKIDGQLRQILLMWTKVGGQLREV